MDGAELLIHIGIDTVNLAGRGFRPKVSTGEDVRAGQVLVEFDPDVITAAGYSLVTPVLVTNPTAFGPVTPAAAGNVRAGDLLLTVAAKTVSRNNNCEPSRRVTGVSAVTRFTTKSSREHQR